MLQISWKMKVSQLEVIDYLRPVYREVRLQWVEERMGGEEVEAKGIGYFPQSFAK